MAASKLPFDWSSWSASSGTFSVSDHGLHGLPLLRGYLTHTDTHTTKMGPPVVFLGETLQFDTHSPQLVELSGHGHILATVEPNHLGRKSHGPVTSDFLPPDLSSLSFTHSSRHPASVTTANICCQVGKLGRSPESTCRDSSNHGLLEGTSWVQPAKGPLQQQQEVTTSPKWTGCSGAGGGLQ